MSGPGPRTLPGRDHERARELAAARQGGFLMPAEIAWLDGHLATCDDCRMIAAAYGAQRSLFDVARGAYPETPRDLWARTAAAIEAGGPRRRRAPRWLPTLAYAPLVGALVVAVAVGAGLLNGLPAKDTGTKGEEPEATPFALTAGDVQVVSRGDDGALQLGRQTVDEVCPLAAETCSLNPTPKRLTTELQTNATAWDAIISPDEEQVVVVERGDGAQGVYVLNVTDPGAAPVASDAPSGGPATATPPPASETPRETPAESPDTVSTAPSSPADESPTITASEQPTDATASGEPSAAPTAAPSDTASDEPPSEAPSAETTPKPTPETTPEPTPSVEVTPLPGGAIEIASNVAIVGDTAAYSPDGTRFAFTARPVDGGVGPDVFVWTVGDPRALAVTSDHASLFAGWLGTEAMVSRVTGDHPRTVILDLRSGDETPAHDGAMWRPAVGPDAASGVWWDGTVDNTTNGLGWTPAKGRLVLERWPDGDADPQVLATTGLTDWQAQWDGTGRLLAVWTSTAGPGKPGVLSLYAVDPRTGRADLANPKLDKEPAYAGFSIRNDRLTWSAPADGGDRTVQVLAWKGDTFGRLELLTGDGTTVVR
ncbi:MAG TPA: hypothetical protein VFQ75_03500 [Candidatus Limnocylindrales bacterium]|nr:hypothetical protein [Candidatus Limnocylindrales bacterium]